jgi:hypothetical protein
MNDLRISAHLPNKCCLPFPYKRKIELFLGESYLIFFSYYLTVQMTVDPGQVLERTESTWNSLKTEEDLTNVQAAFPSGASSLEMGVNKGGPTSRFGISIPNIQK